MTTARKTTSKASTTRRKSPAKKTAASASRFAKKAQTAAFKNASTATSAASAAAKKFSNSHPFASYAGEPQDWFKNSNEMMQKFFEQSTQGLSDWQKTAPFANANFGATPSSNFGKNMDNASRSISETMAMGTEGMQLLAESGNSLANLTRQISEELAHITNAAFSEQIELSKELLQCRNVNDVFELQSKSVNSAMEKLYSESMRLSDLLFKSAAEISEPIQQRATQAAERLTKTFK